MTAYLGWEIEEADRAELLQRFVPAYPDIVAHHVTLKMGVGDLPDAAEVAVVGYANDGKGVEALVVEIDGEIERTDGKIYHITWSLDRENGRKPVEANDVIKAHWVRLPERFIIATTPKQFS